MKKLTLLFTLTLSTLANAWVIDGLGEYKFEALDTQVQVMHGPLGEPN
ncbi:MAG TPA: MBL fold metallo-hydrolase, partial [Candidatus Thioglobus sp.]|nr:MBL fold metallo-hydrolase [Candidatus Thioglobus sp.]